MVTFEPATIADRRIYYREEWDVKHLPDFIKENLHLREFAFDHRGNGPSDRYRFFNDEKILMKFMKYRAPFGVYSSVALYKRPWRREGWISSELVFDVDAKDLPVRTCQCDNVCDICLREAKEVVSLLIDTLEGDLGLRDIHVIYSGRGYHIRVLDPLVVKVDSRVRSQIVRYVVGGDPPGEIYKTSRYSLDHFIIPLGYPAVFTERVRHIISHLTGKEKINGVSRRTMNKIIKKRHLIEDGRWGEFKNEIGVRAYSHLVDGIAKMNLRLVDAKVTIDLKRILRLPSSLHSMVSMICTEVKNLEKFNPLDDAVPKFVMERR